jgi:hypothetical protein
MLFPMLFPFDSLRKTVQPFSVAGKQIICSCDDIADCLGWAEDRWTEFLNLNVGIRSRALIPLLVGGQDYCHDGSSPRAVIAFLE